MIGSVWNPLLLESLSCSLLKLWPKRGNISGILQKKYKTHKVEPHSLKELHGLQRYVDQCTRFSRSWLWFDVARFIVSPQNIRIYPAWKRHPRRAQEGRPWKLKNCRMLCPFHPLAWTWRPTCHELGHFIGNSWNSGRNHCRLFLLAKCKVVLKRITPAQARHGFAMFCPMDQKCDEVQNIHPWVPAIMPCAPCPELCFLRVDHMLCLRQPLISKLDCRHARQSAQAHVSTEVWRAGCG